MALATDGGDKCRRGQLEGPTDRFSRAPRPYLFGWGVGPGTFALVPGGVAHTFGNTTDRTARLLVLNAPALDGYFQELAQLWSAAEAPSRELELDLMQRHGMKPAG